MYGIESPGITSSLPISEVVAAMVNGQAFQDALDAQRVND